MSRKSHCIRILTLTIRQELRAIALSPAVLLVLIGGVVGYGVLYNLLYEPSVVREAPIVVVDESHSHLSRTLTRLIDATPSAEVVDVCDSAAEGEEMLQQQRAQAILFIPHDFEPKVGRGERSVFLSLSTTSSFLYYEATAGAVAEAALALGEEIRLGQMWNLTEEERLALANRQSVTPQGIALFNTSKSYADYLIPVVLILILFQTMVMVISMVAGGRRGRGVSLLRGEPCNAPLRGLIVLGRSAIYVGIYALLALFLVGFIPRIFSLPHLAPTLDMVTLLVPFLLATSLFGQAFGRLFRDSDSPILYITVFSVGLIFVSGISFPFELIPRPWHLAYYLLPAPSAISAFVGINSLGASPAEVAPHLTTLWLQALAYFLLASLPKRGFR